MFSQHLYSYQQNLITNQPPFAINDPGSKVHLSLHMYIIEYEMHQTQTILPYQFQVTTYGLHIFAVSQARICNSKLYPYSKALSNVLQKLKQLPLLCHPFHLLPSKHIQGIAVFAFSEDDQHLITIK